MAGNRIEQADIVAHDGEVRREWMKPEVHDMLAGAAELGGDTSVDGDPGFS